MSWGVSPGFRRLLPRSSDIDQLTCLPDPLTPANGFSCSSSLSPYRPATRAIVSMTSMLWSVATLAFSNSGASSYCDGATSLCLVLTGTPSLYSSISVSSMQASTRSGIDPK